ncbi:hypothetical protein CDD82_4177 [Ophiocordyceps australis]|uniref:HPt domain-containing protein n=1 Tax=Ophiocordyceps australis TaxID=1399860 RepID=A0A2C5Y511_9HYPO|nr:hypothetical protein CDD82_4177 [Ophiocordyceps australis]
MVPPTDDKRAPPPEEGFGLGFEDAVDMSIFNQILEMDEPDDHEFSHSIVFGFFDQAEETFESMDTSLKEKDLKKLSSLGHFLKGSSATLGLIRVQKGCEQIQQYGKNENPDGGPEPDSEVCLKRITDALEAVKTDYYDVKLKLERLYDKGDKDKPEEA